MEYLVFHFLNAGFDEKNSRRIAEDFKPKKIKKGEYFVRQGKKSLQLGIIEFGQFQYFLLSNSGEEKTAYVALPNTYIASLSSFLAEKESRENIRALADSVVWVIFKKDLLRLQNEIPKFKDYYIALLEYQICCVDETRFDLITLTAEERYRKLLKNEPELLQQVPLQYIASILGITPRHLSRLRNNMR